MQRINDKMRGDLYVEASSTRRAVVAPCSRNGADTERNHAMDPDGKVVAPADGKIRRNLPAPALRFDWTDWLPYLEDQDIPEDRKRELIESLWSIVVSFVDLGWQVTSQPEFSGEVLDLKAILTPATRCAASSS